MGKAYILLLSVTQADIKYESPAQMGKNVSCTCNYGKYKYTTKGVIEGDPKSPVWNESFRVVYYEKVPLYFRLAEQDLSRGVAKELFKGEVNLEKKVQSDGEMKVQMKGEGKTSAVLSIRLEWKEEVQVVPFKLELFIHTVELAKGEANGEVMGAKAKVRLCNAGFDGRWDFFRDEGAGV